MSATITKIKVERCWGGRDLYFRLYLPNGEREFVRRDRWDRQAAKEALNLLEGVYGYERTAIRFVHK
jgi:hypothetical protein